MDTSRQSNRMSTVHPCLKALNILSTICDFALQAPEDGPKTLAAVAVTCRAFENTALDALWRTLPNLVPLVKCLPPDAWKVKVDKRKENKLVLQRVIVAADLIRVKSYASRIRRFGYRVNEPANSNVVKWYPTIILEPALLDVLKLHQILPLPNARRFRFKDDTWDNFHYLLSPKLVHLEIDTSRTTQTSFLKAMESVISISPSIRSLRLPKSNWRSPPFLRLVTAFQCLEVLYCPEFSLPEDALRVLATSPSLRTLRVNNDSDDFLEFLPKGGNFSHLDHLHLNTRRIQGCSELLTRMDGSHLQSIVVQHIEVDIPPLRHVHQFFQTLQSHCSHNRLTAIHLHQLFDYDLIGSKEDLFTLQSMEPLLSFKCLEELKILIHHKFMLDNASVVAMTAAWPRMRLLHLGSTLCREIDLNAPTGITLDGLIPMAKCWPDLESLKILLFRGEIIGQDIPLQRRGEGACCSKLKEFHVGFSVLNSKPGVVAAFLSDIFPNLQEIITGDEEIEGWTIVNDMVGLFSKVRQQERAWKEKDC